MCTASSHGIPAAPGRRQRPGPCSVAAPEPYALGCRPSSSPSTSTSADGEPPPRTSTNTSRPPHRSRGPDATAAPRHRRLSGVRSSVAGMSSPTCASSPGSSSASLTFDQPGSRLPSSISPTWTGSTARCTRCPTPGTAVSRSPCSARYPTPAEVIWAYLSEVPGHGRRRRFDVFTHIDYAARYWPTEEHGPFDHLPSRRVSGRPCALSHPLDAPLEMNTDVRLRPWIPQWWAEEGGQAVSFGSDEPHDHRTRSQLPRDHRAHGSLRFPSRLATRRLMDQAVLRPRCRSYPSS